MFPRQILHGVAADLCLIVAQAQAGKILREAFIKPVLCRRVVEIQKQLRKVVRDRAPAVFGGEIENDVVAIVSRQEDVEYVECLECGEVFDSDEFRDMEIEEKDTVMSDDDSDG